MKKATDDCSYNTTAAMMVIYTSKISNYTILTSPQEHPIIIVMHALSCVARQASYKL